MMQDIQGNGTEKKIFIIAGPNGAGKTTFVDIFLPNIFNVPFFVNADKIASGLAPFSPEREAILAGKLMLRQIEKYVSEEVSFALETTLAGKNYARKIPEWQAIGYTVFLIFLSLQDENIAKQRVAHRVSQGGHSIPADVIARRFQKGLNNFPTLYKELVDGWFFYDNMGKAPRLVESGGKKDVFQ